MKSVTYDNGVTLQYDDTIAVGDMITAYHKGLHVVTEIVPRGETIPLLVYKRVYDSEHKPVKSKKEQSCDASYCKKAVSYLEKALSDRKQEVDRIQAILQQLG